MNYNSKIICFSFVLAMVSTNRKYLLVDTDFVAVHDNTESVDSYTFNRPKEK